jgi:chromosome segregation ATPase
MAEEFLKKRIEELESELEVKNKEISKYLDKIDYLEETIMDIEDSLSKKSTSDEDPLLKSKVKDMNRKNRELKDRMGFLRLENVQLKQELEKLKKSTSNTSTIRIVAREPLSKQSKISLIKDIIYVESEIKKTNMNKEEIEKKLRKFMKFIRNR